MLTVDDMGDGGSPKSINKQSLYSPLSMLECANIYLFFCLKTKLH